MNYHSDVLSNLILYSWTMLIQVIGRLKKLTNVLKIFKYLIIINSIFMTHYRIVAGTVGGPIGVVVFGARKMKNSTAFVYANSQLDMKDKEWKEKESIGMISKTGAVYIGRLHGSTVIGTSQEKCVISSISVDSDSISALEASKGSDDNGTNTESRDTVTNHIANDKIDNIGNHDSIDYTHMTDSNGTDDSSADRHHQNQNQNQNQFQYSGAVAAAVNSTGPDKLIQVIAVIATVGTSNRVAESSSSTISTSSSLPSPSPIPNALSSDEGEMMN